MNIKRWSPFLFLLCTSPAWATWSLVQTVAVGPCTAASNTCTLTVAATAAGNVLVVTGVSASGFVFTTATAGAGSWVFPATCNVSTAGNTTSSCGYVLSATAGVTSITVTRSGSSGGWNVMLREYHTTSTTGVLAETFPSAINFDGSATTVLTGPTPIVTGTNDLVIAHCSNVSSSTVVSVNAPYTNFALVGAAGNAIILGTSSATAPVFNSSATGAGQNFLMMVLSFITPSVNMSTVGKVSKVGEVSVE